LLLSHVAFDPNDDMCSAASRYSGQRCRETMTWLTAPRASF